MSFIVRVASSAPSCEPDTKMIRSERQIRLGLHLLQRVEHPRQHHRDDDDGGHLVFGNVLEHRGGLELAVASTSVEPSVIAIVACR